jgi:hypothetical protein
MSNTSTRDPGIDPAEDANVEWHGEAPSSEDFLLFITRKLFRLLNNRDYDNGFFAVVADDALSEFTRNRS